MKYFHFTLGPVQSFVSQARRTRDFWAGSFLLSWLSAVAMQSVRTQHKDNQIVFPAADENFMNWLEGKRTGPKPTQGSVPNRFKAIVSDDFEAQRIVKDVQAAWKALADLVFAADIEEHANEETRKIWNRQIAHFWDINWVLTEDKDDNAALDRRKNWRSYVPPEEAGVKCMMMDGWQELSGTVTPYRKSLTDFWEPLQRSMKTDLREGENLCAMAFVKRRFARHFQKLINHAMPSGGQLSGWELKAGVPSVAYMAGVRWLEQVIEHADEAVFQAYFDEAVKLTDSLGEWESRIHCLQKFRDTKPQFKQWTSLDGNVFHSFVLANANTYPDQLQAQEVNKALKKLNDHVKEKNNVFTPASPFYAVLMMDGDSLGKHMSDTTKQPIITQGLKLFTDDVKAYVEKHNGFLIYAGGDDVLALLPLEDALQCAVDLRKHYLHCFEHHKEIKTTLSGAIEYAHLKIPLTKVLYDVHHLLDDVAKERSGRDSIAVRVRKPGGSVIEWSQPWENALQGEQVKINALVDQFRQDLEADDRFSSKFFFKIRERFSLLNPVADGEGRILHDAILQHNKEEGKEEDIDLMCMEYLNSGKTTVKTMAQAKERIGTLLDQCRRVRRSADGEIIREPFLFADGALLVRFLAQKGIER
jgi:CRISPR-associated protein Cmr2